MSMRTMTAGAGLALIATSVACAEDPAGATSGLRFTLPDGWTSTEREAAGGSPEVVLWPDDRQGAVEVVLSVAPGGMPLERVLARVEASLKAAGVAQAEPTQGVIGGRPARGLTGDGATATGFAYRVVFQAALLDGLLVTARYSASRELFSEHLEAFRQVCASLELSPDAPLQARLRALAARCAADLPWAASWEEAAARARRERRLVFVTVQAYPGFDAPPVARIGPLMDPDVAALVKTRFVPFELGPEAEAPFRDPARYGLSASTFGRAALFVTPDGEVVDETHELDPSHLYGACLRALARRPELAPPPPVTGSDPLERAEAALEAGALERAAELLDHPTSVRGWRLKAALHRRRLEGRAGLEALGRARARAGPEAPPDLDVEAARLHLHLAEYEAGYWLLSDFVELHPSHPRIPEALYLLGALQRFTKPAATRALWRRVTTEHARSPWAARAAARLVAWDHPLAHEPLAWPTAEVLAALEPPPPPAPSAAGDVREAAVAFLLAEQRPDGSWVSPFEVRSAASGNPFTEATTAICAVALLPRRERPDVLKALRRAYRFLLGSAAARRGADRSGYLDYQTWADVFLLDALAARLALPEPLREVERPAVAAAARAVLADVQTHQRPTGGWSYMLNLDAAAAPGLRGRSVSFMTAAAVLALLRAREAGLEVPSGSLEAGLTCLESLRLPDGSYRYFGPLDGPERGGVPGAAGRGPACALALLRGGRADAGGVRSALELFVAHDAALFEEREKTLMHTGPEGQGSHYLFFDVAYAGRAIAALPADERGRFAEHLRERLLAARAADGSFVGTPLFGRPLSTAFALWALDALAAGPR